MKYDEDCAKAILLKLEEADYPTNISFMDLNNSLPAYSDKPITVESTCLKLEEAGYITLDKTYSKDTKSYFIDTVTGITISGSEYLSSLRKHPEQVAGDNYYPKKKGVIKRIFKITAQIISTVAALFAIYNGFASCVKQTDETDQKISSTYNQTDSHTVH